MLRPLYWWFFFQKENNTCQICDVLKHTQAEANKVNIMSYKGITAKSVFGDHYHERPPVLKNHIFLTEGHTFPWNCICHQRSPNLKDHIFFFFWLTGWSFKTGSTVVLPNKLYIHVYRCHIWYKHRPKKVAMQQVFSFNFNPIIPKQWTSNHNPTTSFM